MRRFFFQRDEDVSGASGVGIVVHGIQFADGTCVVHWLGERPSTVVWNSIEDAIFIHGHGGATRLVWVDHKAPDDWELRMRADASAGFQALPGLENVA